MNDVQAVGGRSQCTRCAHNAPSAPPVLFVIRPVARPLHGGERAHHTRAAAVLVQRAQRPQLRRQRLMAQCNCKGRQQNGQSEGVHMAAQTQHPTACT